MAEGMVVMMKSERDQGKASMGRPILSFINHSFIVSFLTLSLFPILSDKEMRYLFVVHPVMMLLGFCLVSEGLLWSTHIISKERYFYTNLHLILQSASLLVVLVGFGAVYYNKIVNGKLHFQSWHAFFGAIVTALLVLQNLMGFFLYFFKFLVPSMGTREKVRFKRGMANLHRVFAVIDYILLFVVIWLGFGTNWALRTYTFCDYFPQILGILAAAIMVMVLLRLSFIFSWFKRSENKENPLV